METRLNQPKKLHEAILYFSDPDRCIEYVKAWRWSDGVVVCPTCGGKKVKFLENQKRWQCSSHHSKRQFSVKVGTVMEDSPLGLDKWLVAMWLVANLQRMGSAVARLPVRSASLKKRRGSWIIGFGCRCATISTARSWAATAARLKSTKVSSWKARNMHVSERKRVELLRQPEQRTRLPLWESLSVREGTYRRCAQSSQGKRLQGVVASHVEAVVRRSTGMCCWVV